MVLISSKPTTLFWKVGWIGVWLYKMEIRASNLVGNCKNLILFNLEELCGYCHERFGLGWIRKWRGEIKLNFCPQNQFL